MKKSLIILTTAFLMTACSQLTPDTMRSSVDATKTRIKACLTTEAMNAVQDGSAFASPVRTTVKKMTASCLNQLIPTEEQTPTLETETEQQAKSILTTLLNTASQNQ